VAKTVMVTAGGTGGHLFPALALTEELQRRGHVVDLITDMRGDRYGSGFPARNIYRVPAATLAGKNPLNVMKTMLKLGRGANQARKILREVNPACIIGFGGYPTFPPIMAAKLLNIPGILHEQNAVMGRANRMLATRAAAIALSFAKTEYVDDELAQKARHTGNPVRDKVIEAAKTPYPARAPEDQFNLLIFGGSQGARYFSDTMPEVLARLPDDIKPRLHVVQQCREEDMQRVRDFYKKAGIHADLSTFFADLPQIIAEAHLVIGRSGASTISELAVIGRPSILVPLPHALDNDQLRNARFLQEAGGAFCIEQKDLDMDRLATDMAPLVRDPELLQTAAAAARQVGMPDAVARLADLVEEVAG